MIESIFTGLIDNVLWFFIGVLAANYKSIWVFFQSLARWNKDVRFSISYLYQIKHGDKYLVIKGNKIDQYQPVGGVYKSYASFAEQANDMEVVSESKVGFYEDGDLRFTVKGKNVPKVIKWFSTGKNREISVYREFYEELIRGGFLPTEALTDLKIEFLRQIKPKMKYSQHFKKNEIIIYDIYCIELNEEHLVKLVECSTEEKDLLFINREDIERECISINGKSVKIGAHTKHIL